MLEEVKKIRLEELNKQKEECTKEIEDIRQNFYQIQSDLWHLYGEQSNGLTVRGNFSFLEKWITRRKAYKKYKKESKRLASLPRLISETEQKLAEEKERVREVLNSKGLYKKFEELSEEIEKTENAKTLREIGISPIEAIEMLKSNGITAILTDADKTSFSNPRDYSSKSSLMCVHKTQYMPNANMIKSAKDSNALIEKEIELNGRKYDYSYRSERNTVHFAMNDEVSSHAYGSWEDCKYAVLIPFEDIPNRKIGRAAPMDTFTRGSVELSENTWILCPKKDVKTLQVFNPKAHVIGYEGENVKGFSRPFLTQLGYHGESVGMWNWSNDESNKQFYDLMEKENIETGTHTYTYFYEDENILTSINHAVALSKMLRDNHLITSPEDIDNIMNQLKDNNVHYGRILSELCTKSEAEADKEPDSIKVNNRQVDIFLDQMTKSGFNILPNYENVIRELSRVSLYGCNDDNKDTVFKYTEEATETEKNAIERLKNVLTSDDKWYSNKTTDAFDAFISTVIGDSILHSQERGIQKETLGEEK